MQRPGAGMSVRGLYQRMSRRLPLRCSMLMVLAAAAMGQSAIAEEDEYDRAQAQHPALFKVYYDENVLEYCGLLTHESALGFVMQRDDLLAQRPLSKEDVRVVRVAGAIAADKAFGSHGLAQTAWCNGEGKEAYNRFVARYHATPYGTVPQTE